MNQGRSKSKTTFYTITPQVFDLIPLDGLNLNHGSSGLRSNGSIRISEEQNNFSIDPKVIELISYSVFLLLKW